MRVDRGYFFVPAIDIGLVYSPGQTALMTAKTPTAMHLDMIGFAKRYNAKELLDFAVVEQVAETHEVDGAALLLAKRLTAKGKNALYRRTLHGIKKNLYADAYRLLTADQIEGMGFQNKPKGVDRAPASKL